MILLPLVHLVALALDIALSVVSYHWYEHVQRLPVSHRLLRWIMMTERNEQFHFFVTSVGFMISERIGKDSNFALLTLYTHLQKVDVTVNTKIGITK